MMNQRPIVITGFTYAFPQYRRVWESAPHPERLRFILPSKWPSRDRSKIFRLPNDARYTGTWTASYGGKSTIRGFLKGWLPFLFFPLLKLRIREGTRVLFSCSEPNLMATFSNGLAAKILGMKHVIYSAQNLEYRDWVSGVKKPFVELLIRMNLALADEVITCNRAAIEILHERKPAIPAQVIPFAGVEMSESTEQTERDPRLVLFAGSLDDDRKGADVLIRACAMVREPLTLLIIGSGIDRPELEVLAHQLLLPEQYEFRDWAPHDEFVRLRNQASVFAYPSRRLKGWEEQFGFAMAEAQAASTPVIATTTGSIAEVVQNGKTGLLVPPENPEALADAISTLLGDRQRWQEYSHAASRWARSQFSHAVIAAKLEEALDVFA